MINEQHIFAFKKKLRTRKSWLCSNGELGTVEEVARDFYIYKRGFKDCLIDSACVYGGLAWLLFHDILFHNNLNCKQPLCSQYLYKPEKFFKRYETVIEERLAEYIENRNAVFTRQISNFYNHPFFTNPKSQIPKYYDTWMKRNHSALADFVSMSVEHGDDELIREITKTSRKGRNAGWPDLVAWSETDLLFAEVKSTDKLSVAQRNWMSKHEGKFNIELIRIHQKM